MTALAQIALEFCKSCLGWEEADTFTIGRKQQVVRNLSATSGAGDIFNATDLNTVMETVRKWCRENSLWWEIHGEHNAAGIRHYIQVMVGDYVGSEALGGTSVEVTHKTVCYALLAACVEASRKLKA
jgi:hypothetical protein